MSWEIRDFHAEHVRQMRLQPHQARVLSIMSLPYIATLGQMGPSASAFVNGEVIASAGIACQAYGVGTLWAFISLDAGKHFFRLHRGVKRLMGLVPLRRIESSSEVSFAPGCRWLELLGFESEGVMKRYGPDESDHMRYAWLSQPSRS